MKKRNFLSPAELALKLWPFLTKRQDKIQDTYRCDYNISKWTDNSPACSLEGCNADIGDSIHLLSGHCPALRPTLVLATCRGLETLQSYPLLQDIVLGAVQKPPLEWSKFLADPSSEPEAIIYRQTFGPSSIFPLLRFARTFIWAMHRKHMNLKGLRI